MRTTARSTRRLLALVVAALACGDGPEPAETPGDPATSPSEEHPTLVEIMQQLEIDMERLSHGVWVADFDSIAVAARAVADHPTVGPDERAEIMGILGEGGAGFREADLRVHDTALAVEERAGAGDLPGVLTELTRLQEGCVACHTGYRDAIQSARQ